MLDSSNIGHVIELSAANTSNASKYFDLWDCNGIGCKKEKGWVMDMNLVDKRLFHPEQQSTSLNICLHCTQGIEGSMV